MPPVTPATRRAWARPGAAFLLAALAALPLGAGPAPRAAAASDSTSAVADPRAVRVADRVMEALGGRKRWDALPGLRWTFGVSVNDTVRSRRTHAWNKHTGWHRVGYRTAAGDSFVIIHRVGTPEGRAWANGQPIEGDSLQKLIARGMRLWTNDMYWMLMPYKMRDPGVNLAWDSERRVDGRTYDVIAMSFAGVGQTPQDRYWVFVNRATRRIELWEMVLQGEQPPPVRYTWDDWVRVGGLWFPSAHRNEGRNVFTRDVQTVTEFDPAVFAGP